ncbi:uncharacterized protein CXQ87_000599 [Candidozyma duobushaemuli]|uniref:2,3-diketo-5-methylthio-1-phosphopentane phosphatase n=1 Tax=Candidozyma duobushaemuli TaxID=1231522 RepID=A0A2V1AJI1_9ASCO|nr:uncharacterized protein CXQ87_000599 [[Candida] duobushaemulonis]PVH17706.1 hypothetical protein CXQ87_000599 [[Candida] duobushaemulonis]
MSSNIPAIVFTDWDGTVTLQDSNDYLTENLGFGRPKRLEVNDEILYGKKNVGLDSNSFPECIDFLLKNIQLDPGFKEFFQWADSRGIPVVVVSSGMTPIIHALLERLVGAEAVSKILIMSNDVKIDEAAGKWNIVYKHPESGFGHDKSLSIKEYLTDKGFNESNMPPLFYCGDGVSDLSAAKETNLLFAKHGKDLIKYCRREDIPYTEFNDFAEILAKIKSIVDGGKSYKDYIEN